MLIRHLGPLGSRVCSSPLLFQVLGGFLLCNISFCGFVYGRLMYLFITLPRIVSVNAC